MQNVLRCALAVGLGLCVKGGRPRRPSAFSFTSDEGCVLSRDSPLLVLTLIAWLRNVCGLFTVKLFPPHCTLEESRCLQHTRKEREILLTPSVRAESLHTLFGIFYPGHLSLFPPCVYSCNHLFTSVWTQGHLFYIWGYKESLRIYPVHVSPASASGAPWGWLQCPLDLWFFGVLSTSSLSGTISFSGLIFCIS